MKELFEQMYINYSNVTKMTIFNYFKTGNTFFDTVITTLMISSFTWLLEYMYRYQVDRLFYKLTFDTIKNWFFKKNSIIIEGKRGSVISAFSCNLNTSSIYSDRFKALWAYIINNIDRLDTVYSIKETHSNFQSSSDENKKSQILDIFMVFQDRHFELDNGIFVRSVIEEEEERNEKEKSSSKTDKITITLYSYKYSVSYLKKYVDNITEKYLSSIKQNRKNIKFIYCLEKVEADKNGDVSPYDIWREDEFESARTFNNIFFDGKKEIISKIDFFLHNRDWYYKKGITYSLGIGLHGPPGTGKTSFIKALANYTNRHVIVLSLKIIKTKRQLERFFFENTYNEDNEKNDISFDKKIIVFEDIDCIGDIVLDRNKKEEKPKTVKFDTDNIKIGDVLQSICELNENGTTKVSLKSNEEAITLDDILNLWDGIRETPGRILIISSNHYDKLDPALVRPGRIDITHELNNVSHNTLEEMYLNLFETKIDREKLKDVQEFLYSPAEIINMYVSYKTEEAFMNRLLENKKN